MKTELLMLTEHSPFMMGFVFRTAAGRTVIIDGGRPEDMPWLMELVGEREITAWILTHPHLDHISGFNEIIRDAAVRERVKNVYYNFPSPEFAIKCDPNDLSEIQTTLDFQTVRPLIADREVIVQPGMAIDVDELHIEFLFCGEERHFLPKPNLTVNESSIAFKVTSPGMRSVLFLGDLGPESGREMLACCPEKLPSDIVQMSHHGHSGVSEAVYRKINPTACLWCAPDWLWDEADIEFEPELWGTRHTRAWMEKLGVHEHYVTKNGTQSIRLF